MATTDTIIYNCDSCGAEIANPNPFSSTLNLLNHEHMTQFKFWICKQCTHSRFQDLLPVHEPDAPWELRAMLHPDEGEGQQQSAPHPDDDTRSGLPD